MNNEIKEILKMLEAMASNDDIAFLPRQASQLLDYITNLQEENKRLNENNQAMQEEMSRTWKIADDYKSRNEKAINYIRMYYYEDLYDDTLTAFEDKLLNILQGSDKDE